MRLRFINPNTSVPMTVQIRAAALRAAAPDVAISAVCPSEGAASIESHAEEILAARAVVDEIERAETGGDGIDGFVVACFGDPGLDAAREVASVPVVGIAEAAMHAATLVGRHFGVVTTLPRTLGRAEDLVCRYGFERACVALRAADLPVLALEDPDEESIAAIETEARKAVEREGADAIVLGCAGMAGLCRTIESRIGVPVIEGVAAATGLVSALVRMGTTTAKHDEYAYPPQKTKTRPGSRVR
ncbi:aspartate/glutamate racemase family protein [Glycomyces sp. L485]|uniref:aspartate/glutamate racemase family protein n=1 Tax=Glycomyces sp. L485 TaxID=2909235 RepID=UPI001F4B29F4|nr:aspartate/glutamate racemase family protein [Glycomyces sp. L485]MCH7230492.1 aspartate/glutamate racemase family protein [Glycomyces sp. L485]